MVDVNILQTMLESGQDNALLRFTLGSAFIKHGKYKEAVEHLAMAVELEPDYSAAWKAYAGALAKSDQTDAAVAAYEQGIKIAEKKGDKQAAREMTVFLKRLQKHVIK